MGELTEVSTAGLKYELRWFGDGQIGDSSTDDMSVFVSFEWMLLVLASLSSPEDDEVDEEKSRRLEPLISGALYESMLVVETKATGEEI